MRTLSKLHALVSPTIEVFKVAIDATYGDTTHIYNAYIGNNNQPGSIGIRIAENVSESSIISPRFTGIPSPLAVDAKSQTIVLFWDSPGDPKSECLLPPGCNSR